MGYFDMKRDNLKRLSKNQLISICLKQNEYITKAMKLAEEKRNNKEGKAAEVICHG